MQLRVKARRLFSESQTSWVIHGTEGTILDSHHTQNGCVMAQWDWALAVDEDGTFAPVADQWIWTPLDAVTFLRPVVAWPEPDEDAHPADCPCDNCRLCAEAEDNAHPALRGR